jgi:phosphoglycerate dehydrogenase-like enzyme
MITRKLLPECDFVSLHMPLVESTVNMISKKQLQSMKRSAYLVNCARGGIVNEQDFD